MNLDTIVIATIGALTLAGFVQSVTGFGFGMVAMALLPLFMSFKQAYFILIIPNLIVCAANFFTNCRYYQWRQGLGLVIGSCVAVPVGFFVMIKLKSDWLLVCLGALISLFAVSELLLSKTRPLRVPERCGWAAGLLSGALSGGFAMGGPPAVAYVYSQGWGKQESVALLQVVFGTSSVVCLVLMHGAGLMTPALVRLSLLSLVPLLLATYAGNWVLQRLRREHLRLVVLLLLLAIGLNYIFKR